VRELERWIEERVAGHRVAVVGVGNALRGDDGAGPAVVAQLHGGRAQVIDAGIVPENFLGVLIESAPDLVLFVDSLEQGARPGRCAVISPRGLESHGPDTHAPSLRLMAKLMEGHGIESWVLGIQPGPASVGVGLTPPVARSVERLARALRGALEKEESHA
jgi:hydrogenase maturation protease